MSTATRASAVLAMMVGTLVLPIPGTRASGLVGNLSVGLGGKWFSDQASWPDHDEGATEMTLGLLAGHRALPFMLNAYFAATKRQVDMPTEDILEQKVQEIGVGASKMWGLGRVHPFLGAGISTITARYELLYSSHRWRSRTTRRGPYISAGALLRLVGGLNVGAQGRFARVDEEYHPSLGGWSFGAHLGWGRLPSH